jgi:hypothetical protein
LHFYSYEKDSKEQLSIDEYVTIRVNVSLPTDVENLEDDQQCDVTKQLRNGQLVIRRNGVEYNTLGGVVR